MEKNIRKLLHFGVYKFFLLAILFLFSACSRGSDESSSHVAGPSLSYAPPVSFEQPVDTVASTPIAIKKAGPFSEKPQGRELYRAVLQEELPFYSTYDQEDMTLKQFTQSCNGGEPLGAKILEFAVVDLDNDGQLEIVLPLTKGDNDIFVYEVLRCQNDIVYGYSLPYRAFQDLRTDGTFYGSSGAGWQNWYTIQFDADTYTTITFAHTEMHYDSHRSEVLFFVGEENVSESVYYDRISDWRNDGAVRWYSFTDESLIQVFTE